VDGKAAEDKWRIGFMRRAAKEAADSSGLVSRADGKEVVDSGGLISRSWW